ncbi:DASS family sodium-coupled anion symporter [bacterium]|nr:DASS family sodium-coupled anion symporter [bacterium]
MGLFLAPLLFVIFALLPFRELSTEAHWLAAIVVFTATLWVTEAIPIPVAALLGPALCVIAGVGPMKAVFAPFANPVIFLFMGSFMLAQAMFHHGLDRRIAVTILSLKWVGPRPGRILFAFAAVTLLLSMWLSNTATTAMMYPIGLSLLSALGKAGKPDGKAFDVRTYAPALLILCAYSSSLGGIGTPVGSPPNLIGLGMIDHALGIHISFVRWMILVFPISILLFAFLLFYVGRKARAQFPEVHSFYDWIRIEKESLGTLSRGEKNTAIAFLCTAALWILPGIIGIILGDASKVTQFLRGHLPEAAAAIIGATLLFVLPVNWRERTFTMNWKQAVQIDWGTILLFGGGLALGSLMFSTGLAEAVGHALQILTGARTVVAMTFLFTILAVFTSDLASNTASANVIIPIAIGLAQASGVNPLLPALGACIGASMGFLLPVSTPPNAIVYGSGLVPMTRMIRYGIVMDLVAAFVVASGLLLWGPVVLSI